MKRALLILAAAVGVAAPLAVALGAMGSDLGWMSFETGFWVLTLTVGWWLALGGVGLGLVAAILNGKGLGRAWPWLVAGLAMPGATLAGLWLLQTRLDAGPPVVETATDWADPLVFSQAIMSRRAGSLIVQADPVIAASTTVRRAAWAPWEARRVAQVNAEVCPGARTVPRLATSREVIAALEAEGVRVVGESPWRVEGFQESAFYGRVRDVVVRMEPGATDIRVSERLGDVDLGDTCDLTASLVERLSR
jgi:hypothetical protein